MRITEERQASRLRQSELQVSIAQAVLKYCEKNDEVTNAEIMAALSLEMNGYTNRAVNSETKPYED